MPETTERNPRLPQERPNLPAVVVRPGPARPGGSAPAGSSFVSQLIAERQHLPPQRERRRATMAVAVGSYRATEEQAVRRVPPGYRKTLVV